MLFILSLIAGLLIGSVFLGIVLLLEQAQKSIDHKIQNPSLQNPTEAPAFSVVSSFRTSP